MSTKKVSKKPYILDAVYTWIEDCKETPMIGVDSNCLGVSAVLKEYADDDGLTILNIGHQATNGFSMDKRGMSFYTKFGRIDSFVNIPVESVVFIYSKETVDGWEFTEARNKLQQPKKPVLKLV